MINNVQTVVHSQKERSLQLGGDYISGLANNKATMIGVNGDIGISCFSNFVLVTEVLLF